MESLENSKEKSMHLGIVSRVALSFFDETLIVGLQESFLVTLYDNTTLNNPITTILGSYILPSKFHLCVGIAV